MSNQPIWGKPSHPGGYFKHLLDKAQEDIKEGKTNTFLMFVEAGSFRPRTSLVTKGVRLFPSNQRFERGPSAEERAAVGFDINMWIPENAIPRYESKGGVVTLSDAWNAARYETVWVVTKDYYEANPDTLKALYEQLAPYP